VHFYPAIIYFPAGGASVMHIAAPGEVTLARLARRNGRYWMAIVPGEFLKFPAAKAAAKAKATTPEGRTGPRGQGWGRRPERA
jgi:L-fucose isomerase